MKRIRPVSLNYSPVIIVSVLLTFMSSFTSAEQNPSGLSDIDIIREEIKITETDASNYDSRRSGLMRWWRLFWRQGYDLRSFDEVADKILDRRLEPPEKWRAIEEGYQVLEAVLEKPVLIEFVKGEPSRASTTTTDWPVFMGPTRMNQGSSPDVGPSEGSFAWRFPKGYYWNATPVIKDGKIYVSSPGIDVVAFCLDEKTGKTLWRARQYGNRFYSTATTKHSPWVMNGNVIIRTDASDTISNHFLFYDEETGERIQSPRSSSGSTPSYLAAKQKAHALVLSDGGSGEELWTYQTSEVIAEDPAIEGDMIYMTTLEGTVQAFHVKENIPQWSVALDASLRGKISVGESLLYIGSKDGNLFALNRKTGEQVWMVTSGDPESRCYQYYSEVLEAGDRIYVGGASGFLYCYGKSDGSLIWKHEQTDWVRSRPYLRGDKLYVATLDGNLTALSDEGDSARLLWRKKLNAHGFTANLSGGRHGLYASGRDYMMYAVDHRDGEVLWRHGILDGAWVDGEFYFGDWSGGLLGSPTVVDGIVYIGGPDGFVNAVDADSGEEIWKFEAPGSISNSTTVIDGKVLFGHLGGYTEHHGFDVGPSYHALDSETGEEVWQSRELGKVWVSGAYNDGVMFIGDMNGHVYGVDPNTGEKLWSYWTSTNTSQEKDPLVGFRHGWPPGVYSIPLSDDKHFYTGSWSGYYFAFEQKTGELVWRCQTGNPDLGGGLPDSAAPMLWKDYLYVQKRGSLIAAINKHTGEIDWEWKPPFPHLQNGTVGASNGRIYGSTGHRVTILPYVSYTYALSDVESGSKKLWQIRDGAGLTAPVLTEDSLIFGSSTGMFVNCVDPESGALKWRLFTGGEMLENVPAIYGNKFYAISKNGWLNAIQ